jgi:hypothetical protein
MAHGTIAIVPTEIGGLRGIRIVVFAGAPPDERADEAQGGGRTVTRLGHSDVGLRSLRKCGYQKKESRREKARP